MRSPSVSLTNRQTQESVTGKNVHFLLPHSALNRVYGGGAHERGECIDARCHQRKRISKQQRPGWFLGRVVRDCDEKQLIEQVFLPLDHFKKDPLVTLPYYF